MKDLPLETLKVAGLHIRYHRPPSAEHLLEELAARDPEDPELRDERLPYWADLWPSCHAMIHAIRDRTPDFTQTQVIELGAGLGLSGIAAGLAGAAVLLTDYSPDALRRAAANWRLNLERPPRTRLLDWRDPPEDLQADILIASDVAYEERFFTPLINTFRSLLRPGGKILLTEPRRAIGRDFFPRLRKAGFLLTTSSINIESHRPTTPIDLHVIQPRP